MRLIDTKKLQATQREAQPTSPPLDRHWFKYVRLYIIQNLIMFPIQHNNTATYHGVTDVLTTNVTPVYAYTNNLCMQ